MVLQKIPEPNLLFNYNQEMEDPRDGLTLFGPLDKGKPFGIRTGVIGTKDAIFRFNQWVQRIQDPIDDAKDPVARPYFPGFEAAFGIPWNTTPTVQLLVTDEEIDGQVYLTNAYNRVYRTVEIFTSKIIKAVSHEDSKPDIWFVLIPERIHKYCRPLSRVEYALRIDGSGEDISSSYAKQLKNQPSLFPEDNEKALPYQYDLDFHNQLKARLLPYGLTTQIIRETTLAYEDFKKSNGRYLRNLGGM